jgi:Uma2 family endonuclease
MNVSLRIPSMTREQFLDWVERQEAPFEFDGFEPIPMTGGTRNHSQLCSNILFELRKRLEGSSVAVLPEAGVATIGNAVRYPDVLITNVPGPGTDRVMPGVVAVFEVLSESTARTDHQTKLREYSSVASIKRYVIVDNLGPDLLVYARAEVGQPWTVQALTTGDTLHIPEVGIDVPVDDVFRGIKFPD